MKGFAFINTIHAVIIRDDDGTEGIMGLRTPEGGWVPLVFAGEEKIDGIIGQVQGLCNATGKQATVVKFTNRETVTTIIPVPGVKPAFARVGRDRSEIAVGAENAEVLSVYTVYDTTTKDHPGKWVVRRFEARAGVSVPCEVVGTADSLEEARGLIPGGLAMFRRSPDDDAAIQETWL